MTTATTYMNYRATLSYVMGNVDGIAWNLGTATNLKEARQAVAALKNEVLSLCAARGLNDGPILVELMDLKAASQDGMREKCRAVSRKLQGLRDTLDEMNGQKWAEKEAAAVAAEQNASELEKVGMNLDEVEQVSACFVRGIDVLQDSVCVQPSLFVHLPNACVDALLSAPAHEVACAAAPEVAPIAEVVTLAERVTAVQGSLKAGYTVAITSSAHGQSQVSVHKDGSLCWRGWDCEPDFDWYFAKALEQATVPAPEAHPEADRAPSRELAFINRTVSALDDAPMGTHSVYVHWFRIDYGCWLDAEEVVNAGGRDAHASHRLADYLEESLGLSAADVAELMVRDWDCQDAEGLAARCIGNYGGFDWLKLEELLEVDVEPAVLVAGLACGLEPDAIEDAYMGEWGSDEDMAAEQWEQGGMLDGVPEAVRSYIDWELVARDMLLGSDVVEANGHYFRAA